MKKKEIFHKKFIKGKIYSVDQLNILPRDVQHCFDIDTLTDIEKYKNKHEYGSGICIESFEIKITTEINQ